MTSVQFSQKMVKVILMSNPVVLKIPKQPIRGKSVATLVEIRYFEIKEIWLMWNFKCFIKIFYKFEQRRSNINLKCKLLALVLKVGSLEAQVLISNADNLSIVNSQANNQQATWKDHSAHGKRIGSPPAQSQAQQAWVQSRCLGQESKHMEQGITSFVSVWIWIRAKLMLCLRVQIE